MNKTTFSAEERESRLACELECEFTVDPAWVEFGAILSAAHAVVYDGAEHAQGSVSVSVSGLILPERISVIPEIRQNGRRLSWSLGSAVSLAVLVFTVVFIWGWYEIGVRDGAGSGPRLPQETISHWEDGEISESKPQDEVFESADDFDWEAGEGELADFDRLVQQVEQSDAPLDWEIAMLGNSLRELTEETKDENWF